MGISIAEHLAEVEGDVNPYADAFNFGPYIEANRTVEELIKEVIKYWEGKWQYVSDSQAPHEASRLHLQIDKAQQELGWRPRWDFRTTVERTVNWYRYTKNGSDANSNCLADIAYYQTPTVNLGK